MRYVNLVSNQLWCLRISSEKEIKSARFEILTRLLLRILVFWDVTVVELLVLEVSMVRPAFVWKDQGVREGGLQYV